MTVTTDVRQSAGSFERDIVRPFMSFSGRAVLYWSAVAIGAWTGVVGIEQLRSHLAADETYDAIVAVSDRGHALWQESVRRATNQGVRAPQRSYLPADELEGKGIYETIMSGLRVEPQSAQERAIRHANEDIGTLIHQTVHPAPLPAAAQRYVTDRSQPFLSRVAVKAGVPYQSVADQQRIRQQPLGYDLPSQRAVPRR